MGPGDATQISTPSDLEIRVTRVFQAPRRDVADAFTKPELLQRWMGVFGDWSWASCEIDLREGGAYRYVWRQPDGTQLALSGHFREIVPGERYVQTQVYEDTPEFPGEMLVTMTFVEVDGRTTLEMTTRYASQAERDLDLQYMPSGLEPGFARLDELLSSAG